MTKPITREPLRVLVVDREGAGCINDLLADGESRNIQTLWAGGYEEGLRAIRQRDVDVCVVRQRLGPRSGIDFLEEEEVEASNVPVILTTDREAPDTGRRAQEAGAADCLPREELTGLVLERAIRHVVERARRQKVETRLRLLVSRTRELVSVLDEDGTLLFVSPSLNRVLGFDPSEKIGSPSLLEVHPEDRDRIANALARVIEDPENVHRLRYRVRHADGTWRTLDTLTENCLDDPEIAGIVARSWDVTERVEQERRIEFQSDLLNAVGQAVIATDLDGKVVYWNRAAEEIYGWSEDEALGRNVVELTPSEASRQQAREILETMRRGQPWAGEFEVRRKDGSAFSALVTNTPIVGAEGALQGIVGVSSDITRIKKTEADLRERAKELRTLYQATQLLNDPDDPIEVCLQHFVETLPPGWLYPDITEARLTVEEATVRTAGYRPSPWTLSAEIVADGTTAGHLEVVLTEERPPLDEGPFLEEERHLLDTLARTVGQTLERHRLIRRLARTVANLGEALIVVGSRQQGRRIVSVNPAAERIFGYPAEEMVGRTPEFLYGSPDSFRRIDEERSRAVASDGTFHGKHPLQRKDGAAFQAEETTSLMHPSEGLEGPLLTLVRDVSEARRTQAKLQASEERFRQIAERIEDVFWISTPGKDGVDYVSPAFQDVWGKDPGELYESSRIWVERIAPEDRERVRKAIARQLTGDYDEEYKIIRPDGDVRWIHERAFPVRDDAGHAVRVVGVARDITERKAAEERLGVITREISEVIFILDPGGRVLFTTSSVTEMTGYAPEEIEHLNAFDLVHAEDRPRLATLLEQLLVNPQGTARVQHRLVRRTGEVRHVEAIGRNLMDHPGVGGVLVTARDVTERIAIDERLRESQRLESIGRLSGGIAHDFNNLLTVIRSQTDLLLLDPELPAERAADLRVIQSAADRGASLTNQLLAFSRDQVLEPRVVDLSDVVRSMGDLVDRTIGTNVRLEMDFSSEPDAVEVDPGQLEQVVLNLAVNARDAMPEGGVLRLRTFRDEITEEQAEEREDLEAGTYSVLAVSDTGVGMSEETRTRVFEPFFTTKGGTGGTGLGLAMAYGFVKQSGGTIDVASAPGEGTTFHARFPAVPGGPLPLEEAGASERREAAPSAFSETVLVVEDDPNVLPLVRKILERAGVEVLEAESAEDALELLDEGPTPNLILTDLGLPGISGQALAGRVRESHPELPIVFMSGYAADAKGLKGGPGARIPFVRKPFAAGDLVQTIRKAMEKP